MQPDGCLILGHFAHVHPGSNVNFQPIYQKNCLITTYVQSNYICISFSIGLVKSPGWKGWTDCALGGPACESSEPNWKVKTRPRMFAANVFLKLRNLILAWNHCQVSKLKCLNSNVIFSFKRTIEVEILTCHVVGRCWCLVGWCSCARSSHWSSSCAHSSCEYSEYKKKKTPEKPAVKPKAKEKTGKKPDLKKLNDEKEVVEKTEEKPTKPKSGLKRPAAAAKPSPAKNPAADIPKKKLNVYISLYKRDGVWSCKLNGKEVIRVSCLVKAFFKHMSNWWKPVILELHALRCHCGVKVGMVSLDIVFWYLRWSQLIKYLLKRSHQ